MSKPLAIDLYAGLGGWTEGLLAEGYSVVGFDIERHVYGDAQYPAQLVLQDVLTLHGSQFKDAALIVASPPCQAYSYRAMPWKRAKALPPPDNSLFEACFRIQQEACEAAGRHIPLVVENVCGAQKWVGRARWHFGSFYLWGDVPALMPITLRGTYGETNDRANKGRCEGGSSNHGLHRVEVRQRASLGIAVSEDGKRDSAVDCRNEGCSGLKGAGAGWFNDAKRAGGTETGYLSRSGSKSSARKAASAHIAKIPLPLSRWIARAWYPERDEATA